MAPSQLPPGIPARPSPLLSRGREMSLVSAALRDAVRGRGELVLVTGEPGIGKTRLAQEIAARAAARRVRVLWGRASGRGGTPPYWPWAQAMGTLVEQARATALSRLLGPERQILAHLLPQLRAGRGHAAAPPLPTARIRLFEAVRRVMQRASRQAPLLLVLEDLHWADEGTLQLLELVALDLPAHAILLVATCREGRMSPPLVESLAELARLGVRRIRLDGLSPAATARLIAATRGRTPGPETARQVHAKTDGNPFFVTEIARLPDLHGIPDNVASAVAARVSGLSHAANHVLLAASVLGREFDARVLQALLPDMRDGDLLQALDDALQALVLDRAPRQGHYQFRHALIRDVLYERLSPGRRARWHARITLALGALPEWHAGDRAAELAEHAVRAGGLIGTDAVATYSSLAGERMLAAQAFDEAVVYFSRAWRARDGKPFDAVSAAILAGLGRAEAAVALRWDRRDAWRKLRRAIEFYLETGEIDRVVALATDPCITAEATSHIADVAQRALDAVPRGSAHEAGLLARLGAAWYFEEGDHRRAQAAFSRAVRVAASLRAPLIELRALTSATSVDHFDLRWDEALTTSQRVLELAWGVEDPHSETYARYRSAFALVHLGRPDEAPLHAAASLAAAERLRDRGMLADALFINSTLAQFRGAWHDARTFSDRGLTLSPTHLPLLHGRTVLEYETGQDEVGARYLSRLLEADRPEGPYPLAGAFTAITLALVGRLSGDGAAYDGAWKAARALLARRPSIPNAVVTARMARALVATARRSADDCVAEWQFLESFGSTMPIQWSLVTHRLLGLLAHGAGHRQQACNAFERALTFCRQSGYRPELAWTCHDYAGVLLAAGRDEERRKAMRCVEEGQQIASDLGLQALAVRLQACRDRYSRQRDRTPAGLTPREREVLTLLSYGRTNKEIGGTLSISTNTVAVHVARVLKKTGASNRTEAAAYATRHHLLDTSA